MGQCCGKPADHAASRKGPVEPAIAGHVLRSLSFIQGLKVIPSVSTISKDQDGISNNVHGFTAQTKDYFLAALFIDVGGTSPEQPSAGSVCKDSCWMELEKAMSSGDLDTEACMLAMFGALDKKVHTANRVAKTKSYAMGVVVLGEVGKRRLTVGTVGTCQASLCQVTGSFNHASSTGVLLTDMQSQRRVDAWIAKPDDPVAQSAAVGHVLGLREPDTAAGPKRRAGTTGGAPAAAEVDRSGSSSSAAAGGEPGLKQSVDNPLRRMTAGPRLQAAPDAPHLKCLVATSELSSTCRHVFLVSDALASVLSVPDMASLAHHFTPSHIQLLREAAAGNLAQVNAHPAIKPPGASPSATARSSPAVKSPGGRSSTSTPARAARGGRDKQALPKPAPAAASLDHNGLSLDQVVAQAFSAPKFNPAAMIIHHAKAQHQLIRQRLARWVRVNQAAAPHSSKALAGQVLQGELPPLGEGPTPCGLVCITLEWPLSVTSQQVAVMRCVAAARAFNPGAEYRWHLVRQLVRHMNTRRKRLQSAWRDTLSRVQGHLVQQRRAAEVLAWKHLGAAVVVTGGFQVANSVSGGPAPPSASSTRMTLSPTHTPGFGQSPRDPAPVSFTPVNRSTSSAALHNSRITSPRGAAAAAPSPMRPTTTLDRSPPRRNGSVTSDQPAVTTEDIRALVAEAARQHAVPATLDVPTLDTDAEDGGVLPMITPAYDDDRPLPLHRLQPGEDDDGVVLVSSPGPSPAHTPAGRTWQGSTRYKTVSNSGMAPGTVRSRRGREEEAAGKLASSSSTAQYRRTGPAPDAAAAGRSPAVASSQTKEPTYDLRKAARAAAQSYDLRSSRRTAG